MVYTDILHVTSSFGNQGKLLNMRREQKKNMVRLFHALHFIVDMTILTYLQIFHTISIFVLLLLARNCA